MSCPCFSPLWCWIWQAPKNCQLHRIRHRLKSRRIGMLCSGTCRARVEWNPDRGCISLRSSGLDLLPGFRYVQEQRVNNSPSLQQESMLVLFRNLSFPVKFKIQNIVASCDVKFPIGLVGLAYSHGVSQVTFPGLICRMKQPKIVLLIFVSGKIVFTRAKRHTLALKTYIMCSQSSCCKLLSRIVLIPIVVAIVLIPGSTPYSVRSPVMGSSSVGAPGNGGGFSEAEDGLYRLSSVGQEAIEKRKKELSGSDLKSLQILHYFSKEQLRRPRPARRSSGHSSGEQQGGAPASSRERLLVNICNICHCNTFS